MAKLNFILTIDTATGAFDITNQDTGEVKTVEAQKLKKSTVKKLTEMDTTGEPTLTLEENKYCLNGAAAKFMDVKADDRLAIKMRKVNGVMTPIILKQSSGNRLTRSLTVACRGANNEALAAYGTTFTITALEEEPGTFVLHGNRELPEIIDDNIEDDPEIPEELKVDLATLNDTPEGAVEIDGAEFESMLEGIE